MTRDTHEGLVSREIFDAVQRLMNAASEARTRKVEQSQEARFKLQNLFDGKIFCADCGQRMYFHRKKIDRDKRGRWYAFYEYSTNASRRAMSCTPHYIRQDTLEEKVLSALKLHIQVALDYEELLKKLQSSAIEKDMRAQITNAVRSVTVKLRAVSEKRTRLYDDYAEGILDEEEYTFAKSSYDGQWEQLNQQLDDLTRRRDGYLEAVSPDNRWIRLMKEVQYTDTLNQALVDSVIDKVLIHDGGCLKIVFRYSRDLSMKTTTAKIQRMKQGKYVGAFAPYGFAFHPTERNKLFADPVAAQVVRRIFDFAIAGQKPAEIAKRLNADGVPTPGQYFVAKHPENRKFSAMSEQIAWTYRMVYTILTKQVYTGTAVGHVRKTTVPLSRQTVKQDKSDWIVVRGAHEAIVSEEEFELAQTTIHKTPAEKARSINLYPLCSLVRCGCCGRVMERSRRKTFCCPYGRYNKDGTCDSTVHYSEAELEKVVFGAIQMFLQTAVSNCSFSGKSQKRRTLEIKSKMKILSELQKQVEKWNGQKLSLYEQYVDGIISKQIYLEQKTDLTNKITASADEIGRLEADIARLELPLSAGETMLERAVTAHAGDDSLTYELAHAFVHAVCAFPDGRYEINWKFKDIAVSIR